MEVLVGVDFYSIQCGLMLVAAKVLWEDIIQDLEIRIRQLEIDSDSNCPDKNPDKIQLLSSFRVHALKLIGLA